LRVIEFAATPPEVIVYVPVSVVPGPSAPTGWPFSSQFTKRIAS
jgi:hypothetical protein